MPYGADAITTAPTREDLASLVAHLYDVGRRYKKPLLEWWGRWFRAVSNRTWSPWRAARLPSPQTADIYPAIETLIAWITDQHPKFLFAPVLRRSPAEPKDVAAAQQTFETVFNSWWHATVLPTILEACLWDVFTFGTGFFRMGWSDEVFWGGGPVVYRVDPYAILIDPAATSLDDARWIMEVREIGRLEAYRTFGLIALDVPAQQTTYRTDRRPDPHRGGYDYVPQGQLASIGREGDFPGTPSTRVPPRYGREPYRLDTYEDVLLLRELWLKEPDPERGYRWRYVAESGSVILRDDISPFEHGELPYARVVIAEQGSFWGPSLVEQLRSGQIALNRLLAALQQNVELTGNPLFLIPKGSGIERTEILNQPGQIIDPNPGFADRIGWINPPALSPYVTQLISFWNQQIDRVAGGATFRQITQRRRETTAMVDTAQEGSFIRLRKMIRAWSTSLRVVATQSACNLAQFWTVTRHVPIVGPSGSMGTMSVPGYSFYYRPQGSDDLEPLLWAVWIADGSTFPLSRQQRAAEMLSLWFAGIVDRETVLEAYDLPNRDEVARKMAQREATGLVQKPKGPRRSQMQ